MQGVSVVGVAGWPVILKGWSAGRWRWVWSGSQQQVLSSTGARVYTAHRGWMGVVTGVSAASTEGDLLNNEKCDQVHLVSSSSVNCSSAMRDDVLVDRATSTQ